MRSQLMAASCLLVGLSATCEAQLQNVTVQLPTFHVTSISTTVSVPVGGSTYLGGVNGSRFGRTQFSPGIPGLRNRGVPRHFATSDISVHATIIDHDQIDRALLAEAARRRGAKFDVRGRPVAPAPKQPTDIVGQRWRAGRR